MENHDSDRAPKVLLTDPRPWPFSRSELMAGIRRITRDPKLQLEEIKNYDIPQRRPSIGRIRGLEVTCKGESKNHTYQLVLKEPQGTTRTGTAGVGLREVSVYQILADQLPVRTPRLISAHPLGDWMVMDLLPPGRRHQIWTAKEYKLALDELITLHDRFWGLGDDLTIYNWLARPLDSDFDIYVRAAAAGVEYLIDDAPPALFAKDPQLAHLMGRLVLHADQIAASLNQAPATFIHGDFWPGNLHLNHEGILTIIDWQQAGIAPGVLDLVTFIQMSRWWFDPLPLSVAEIVAYYREGIAHTVGQEWAEPDWETLWDYALLWTFIAHWIDLVVAIPESLVETRLPNFEEIWLGPLRLAARRQNIPEA
jgi:hypothetical protein